MSNVVKKKRNNSGKTSAHQSSATPSSVKGRKKRVTASGASTDGSGTTPVRDAVPRVLVAPEEELVAPPPRRRKARCSKCNVQGGYRGGGDEGDQFNMDLDEETGSGTGNMQKSLKSQQSRTQEGGAGSFIPAPGVPSNGVEGMSFLANNATQGKADSEMDGNVANLEKPCKRGGRKTRRRRKRRKSRKKRKKRTKRRGGRRSKRKRRRRSIRAKLRFSKMPPLYL